MERGGQSRPKEAEARLQAMGPMSTDEKIMMGTMAMAVCLWVRQAGSY